MAIRIFITSMFFMLFSATFLFGQHTDSLPWGNEHQYKICLDCEGDGGGGGTPVTCDATKTTLYVDASRPVNTGDGYSWATAKKTLQAALYIANRCTNISRIHIAEGVYKSSTTASLTNRNANFFIGENYSLYGGYPPGGGTRDIVNNATILDGEIADGFEAYHVMAIYGVSGTIVVDGFQIKNGFADGTGSIELEAGVTMSRSQGAGIYIKDAANVTIRNCAIYQNVASGNGGGIFSSNSMLTLVNTVLANNSAVDGGGLQNVAGSVANLVNCTMGGNTAVDGGGVAYSTTGTTINATNIIAWGNTSVWGGGGTRNIRYSLVQNGDGNTNGLNVDPGFNNPANLDGADNKWFTADDGLCIPFCSPAVNRGDNDANPLPSTDITGSARKFNEQVDMGAYEVQQIPFPIAPTHRSVDGDEASTYVWAGVTAIGVPGCRIILTVAPSGEPPVRGEVRAKTFIASPDNLKYNDLPLLNRHYELNSNARISGATARVTLFFSNGEFYSYNTRTDAVASMPTTDGLNKQNLRIIQFRGVSATGNPGSYDGDDLIVIDPDDADIVWHQPSLTWRVSFNAAGPASGFFLTAVTKYRFSGNGHWTDAARWDNGRIPPAILPGLCEIIIANGSQCTMNVEQKISRSAAITVEPAARLNIQGGLFINLPPPI